MATWFLYLGWLRIKTRVLSTGTTEVPTRITSTGVMWVLLLFLFPQRFFRTEFKILFAVVPFIYVGSLQAGIHLTCLFTTEVIGSEQRLARLELWKQALHIVQVWKAPAVQHQRYNSHSARWHAAKTPGRHKEKPRVARNEHVEQLSAHADGREHPSLRSPPPRGGWWQRMAGLVFPTRRFRAGERWVQ